MINHISIKNFAIIENTEVDFEDGLNIITGETGAGKSIVIEAVSLALGSRADTSSVRTGADKAVVQLAGELDGEEIIITREVSASGKNLCRLNGEIVTLARLNEVCRRLADIHGQYDNQSLLNPDYHMVLVDSYHKEETGPAREVVSEKFDAFTRCRSQLASLLSLEKENARKKDFYKFELDEIEAANLRIGEDTELEERISLLQNSEKIFESIEKSYALLNEASPSLIDGAGACHRAIDEIASYSRELEGISGDLGDIYYRLQDISRSLGEMRENISFSPAELDSLISRLNQIDNLKKKYGSSIEDILAYRDDIKSKLDKIDNFDDEKHRLEKQLIAARNELMAACSVLTELRKKIAAELETKILAELSDLNFKDARMEITVEPLSAPTEEGMDKVEILISANRGEPLKPLYKIASGGEMSRIMLAFKNILSSSDMIPTLIFDEIDNGISGITASIVAKKLGEISRQHQIICITHLPQIAAAGDSNYRIYKETDGEKTFTRVEKLAEDEKVSEVARLLGGTTITDTTLQSARELIAGSRN